MKNAMWTICLVVVLSGTTAEARVWTSVSGSSIDAELVEQRMDSVILRKADGKEVSIRLSKLSADDRTYLQGLKTGGSSNEETAASGPIPEHLDKLFGDKLVNADKDKHSTAELEGKVVGIYFSAHWCPPCRQFTPKLVQAYEDVQEDNAGKLEIVFVSSDHSKGAMYEYMEDEEMPWLALPYKSKEKKKLKNKYQVKGIPRLVILDAEGKILANDYRGEVGAQGADAFEKWL